MGKVAIKLNDGDDLMSVVLTTGNSELMIASRSGKCIRFSEKGVRSMGRDTAGVKAMRLAKDDCLVDMLVIDPTKDVLTVTSNGYGKRSDLEGYRVTNRGGKGVKTMNITDKTGKLVAFESVNDDNDLVIINRSGITLRFHVSDIRVMGRATQGVRIINLEKRSDVIASVCCVESDPEEEVEAIEEGEELPGLSDAELNEPDTDTDADKADETETNE